jgi:ribosome biogenesis protein Nip4
MLKFENSEPKMKTYVYLIYVVTNNYLSNQGGMKYLYGGPYIDAAYQVSIHLTKRFQRRRVLEID